METKKKYENRLIHEKSPYLLQHANNPVDWYPWGEEAFEKAAKEDKPIFLSIGYSTCHWCHVMEHESFENPEIAQMINDYFVPVKVDREERPDIDNIYMTAVQAMTGRGGWPLTVMLTPEKKPFFGGTYYPPVAKWGTPGITDVMESVHHAWKNNRDEILSSSSQITDLLKERGEVSEKGQLSETVLQSTYANFSSMYDSRFGGFGQAPKFPQSHNLSYLLRYWKRSKEQKALDIVEHTLQAMSDGGVYDHLGGGFHRYSTDQQWHVPHFEKMLYDQAILARTYLEAYQITKKERYAQTAREIFDYVLRDLTDSQGGFYSAEDADSLNPDEFNSMSVDAAQSHEKKEGAFYVWRQQEIVEILGEEDARVFNHHFGVRPDGNAQNDPHGEFTGKNILFIDQPVNEDVIAVINKSKEKLLAKRNQRPRPHLDDKVLVDWNGLMISSLAFGARILNEPKYAQAAQKAADFILNKLLVENNRLLHRYRDGEAAIMGTIEDYAFFIHGLLDLYQANFEVKYLQKASDLGESMIELFWDEEDSGFYFTADDAEKLIFRQKEVYDGAIPSGNSVAALDLVRLYHFTLNEKWETTYQELFAAYAKEITQRPVAYSQMMIAADYFFGPSQEIVVATADSSAAEEILSLVDSLFIPNKIIMLKSSDQQSLELSKVSLFTENQVALEGKTTVYICENHICKLPIRDINPLKEALKKL